MLPGTVLMIAALFAGPGLVEWALNITGVILMIVIPWLFAPLQME
jgi:hypothetical protein